MKTPWSMFAAAKCVRDRVGQTPCDEIHHEGRWRLLRYRPRPGGRSYKTPLLIVPSLINRHYILDLLPNKSFVQYLVDAGHDVFVIDWGTPEDEDRYLDFDDFADRFLGRALRRTAREAGSARVHLLGYCLGGTLAAIHAALHPERVASFVALAAPVTFHDDGLLSAWTRTPTFDVAALTEACGNVPWPIMQWAFHLLRPTLTLSKLVQLIDRADDDEFLDGFFALETWGNDNVSFPGQAYRRYVEELYRNDALARGTLTVSGKRVALGAIDCPTLIVTFAHDGIVPAKSASALLEHIGSIDKERLHLPGGHVGAVVSRSGARRLWPKVADFFARHDAGRAEKGAVARSSLSTA